MSNIEIKRDKFFQYHLIPTKPILIILQQRRLGRLNGKREMLIKNMIKGEINNAKA